MSARVISRPGDVWAVNSHRFICADAQDRSMVDALMKGEMASLCFTSPPYCNKRLFAGREIPDWDALMQGIFSILPVKDDGQVLVNLGLIHEKGEFLPYWNGWLSWMRDRGWRPFAWYVWDKGPAPPGDWCGRLAPCFEFIFHFNRTSRKPNKIIPCKTAGKTYATVGTCLREKNGEKRKWNSTYTVVQEYKIPSSVIRISPQRGPIGRGIDHPAVFPVDLPLFIINAFTNVGDIVYEPFAGSGTTMLAAELSGRICRSVEIVPEYTDVAIERFLQKHPSASVILVESEDGCSGGTFDEVAAVRCFEAA